MIYISELPTSYIYNICKRNYLIVKSEKKKLNTSNHLLDIKRVSTTLIKGK